MEGVSHDLKYDGIEDRYHTKIETFLHIQNKSGGDNENDIYWIVRTKDGTSYRFGFYNFSETLSNQNGYTWRWNLDLINDTYGNSIFYNYTENPFPNDNGTAYLDGIEYNNDKGRKINFYYEGNDTPHLRTVYEYGNKIRRSRMLKEIVVNVSDNVVRKYVFEYKILEEDGALRSVSNITEYGNDDVTSLPPIQFEYSKTGNATVNTTWKHEGCVNGFEESCFANASGQDLGTRLVDLNGDGLVDVFTARRINSSSSIVHAFLNNKTGWFSTNWSYEGCRDGFEENCFVKSDGEDLGIRLVDLNGDGLVDIFRARRSDISSPDVYAYLNNGTGWASINWTHEGCRAGFQDGCFASETGQDLGVRLLDLNGDGLVDVVTGRQSGVNPPEAYAFLNNKTGWINKTWFNEGCRAGFQEGCFVSDVGVDIGTRLVDLNGDGLTDIFRARQSSINPPDVFAFLNNGTGWVNATWFNEICRNGFQDGCFVSSIGQDIGTRLVDLNGDGLVDVFTARRQSVKPLISVALNNGTGWINSTWHFEGCREGFQEVCFISETGVDIGTRLVDLNGDGLVDIFRARNSSNGPEVYSLSNNGGANFLLNQINFSLGGGISINYQKSTSSDNTGNDSQSDLNFNLWLVFNITKNNNVEGEHNRIFTTIYNFTDGLYDYATKEFRGFNFAEEKLSDKITNHWFHQDEGRSGKEYKTEILDDQNNPHKTTERIWNSESQLGYFIVLLKQNSEIDHDGFTNNSKIKNTTYDYDEFGNIIYIHSEGDVSDSEDDAFEKYEYAYNTSLWILDKVKNYSLVDSDNSTVLRETFYSYDNFEFGDSPTKGKVTKEENFLNTGSNPITLYGYDEFGNLINKTDANGGFSTYGYGIRDDTNTFPDNMTNSKGQTTNYFYDLGTGNLLAEKDSNGFVKNFTYDSHSIEKTTVLPFDSASLPTQEYNYSFIAAAGKVIVRQREQSGSLGTLDNYKFYDGFGRLIQSKREAPNSRQIVVDTYYDEFGRIIVQSNPYFVSFSEDYSSPNQTVDNTTYDYDVLDRILKVTKPDGAFKNISYNLWNITFHDENENRKDYSLDAYGNIINVIEHNGGESYQTNYTYNGVNELTSIINSLGDEINYTYDTLGRKIKFIDPDLGTLIYQYDLIGNLINRTDNKGSNLTFKYDVLNRKINETDGEIIIDYSYDVNTNLTLFNVSSGDFIINYSYDSRLRKIKEEKIIDGIKLVSEWDYDAADRVKAVTLSSGEIISFNHDEQGLLSQIEGVVNASYSENNNPLSMIYDNLLETNYSYFTDNLRLQRIETSGKQDLNYIYDPVGNVKNINDTIHSRNISMSYDSLNRLIYTQIVDNNPTTLNFIYNAIGNMINMTGTQNAEFTYDSGKPHIPSKVVYF